MTTEPGKAIHLLGDGYEPHVDEIDGRLVYSLPVDSGFVSASFEFDTTPPDLAVLRSDPFRRAALYMVLHTILQRSMIRGNPPVTQTDFRSVTDLVLHAPQRDLAAFLAATGAEHHIDLSVYIDQELHRQR